LGVGDNKLHTYHHHELSFTNSAQILTHKLNSIDFHFFSSSLSSSHHIKKKYKCSKSLKNSLINLKNCCLRATFMLNLERKKIYHTNMINIVVSFYSISPHAFTHSCLIMNLLKMLEFESESVYVRYCE
jgi:hypothetical protein